MNTMLRLVFFCALIILAGSAWSDTYSTVYKCEQQDDAADQDVLDAAAAWLTAAKKVKGGENLTVFVHFPVVATMGKMDFFFVVKAPSLAEWGLFMDNYQGDTLAKQDRKFAEIATCPDNTLFESIQVTAAPEAKAAAKK